MPDILTEALAFDGLALLVLAAFLAGSVRGFSGFGTALVFVPLAAQVLPPLWTVIVVIVMDLFGPLPNIPASLRHSDRRDVLRLLVGAAVMLPLGLWFLGWIDPDLFRVLVSALALAMLASLVLGYRYKGSVSRRLVYGIGGFAGVSGGAAGLPGPPVILFYMASSKPPQVIRANINLFLYVFDYVLLGFLWLKGSLAALPVVLGLLAALPNMAGNLFGAMIFQPGRERLYRAIAYAIIALSAISGLLSVFGETAL